MSQIPETNEPFRVVGGAAHVAPRTPPYDTDAEQALLGAILNNNNAIDKVIDFLKPVHFADSIV